MVNQSDNFLRIHGNNTRQLSWAAYRSGGLRVQCLTE